MATTFTKCYSPIQGVALRITTLNACGTPVTGTGGGQIVYTDGFTQVQGSAEIETGDRKLTRSANSRLCTNVKLPDILLGFTVTADFCYINPAMISRVLNGRLLACTQAPTGTGFAIAEGSSLAHFSLEVWQNVAGVACDPSGNSLYVYNAWPHLFNARPGDYTINEDPSAFQWVADSLPVGPGWTIGSPWLGAACIAPDPLVKDHWFQNLTAVAPPAAFCGVTDTVLP